MSVRRGETVKHAIREWSWKHYVHPATSSTLPSHRSVHASSARFFFTADRADAGDKGEFDTADVEAGNKKKQNSVSSCWEVRLIAIIMRVVRVFVVLVKISIVYNKCH